MVHDQLSVLYRSKRSVLWFHNLITHWGQKDMQNIKPKSKCGMANDEPNCDNRDLIENSIDRYTTNRLMHENHCQPQMQAKNKSPTCSICPKFAVFKQIQKVGRENIAERRNIFSCGSKSENAPVIWNPHTPFPNSGLTMAFTFYASESESGPWFPGTKVSGAFPRPYFWTHGTPFVKQLIIVKCNTLVRKHCWQPWNKQIDLWAASK